MYGTIVEKIPDEQIHYYQWPEFDLTVLPRPFLNPESVGILPRGVRWGWWPIIFEEYVSDKEPDLLHSDPHGTARNRIVFWRRLVRRDVPKGWYHFSKKPSRLEGYADLEAEPQYEIAWNESARRYRKKWLAEYLNKTHQLDAVSHEQFAEAYRSSTVAQKLGPNPLESIGHWSSGGNVECIVAREISTNTVHAGIALLHSPTCKGSYYISGFVHPAAGKTPAMIGLMDHWYAQAQAKGFRFLYFGDFWLPGKPKDWKGFSQFKAKFGLAYIQYPPILFRFVQGTLY